MPLSDRFDNLPPPQYESMPTKSGNGPKRTKNKKQNPKSSGPQIIRPNVKNLSMKGQQSQTRKRKVNPNQNLQNQRKQQRVSNNANAQQRGNWSDYQPNLNGTNNRGRGHNNNFNNGHQGNQFYAQNGGQNGGYRSYHTQGNNPRGNVQNNGPYRRPQNFKQSRNLPFPSKGPRVNGYSKENGGGFNGQRPRPFRNNNDSNDGYQFSNKRANYYRMKNGAGNNNGNRGPNKGRNNGPFKGPRKGKFNRQNAKGNGSKEWKTNGKGFKNGKEPTAADLDKELDRYLMKNPNAEDRNSTMSNHLDKELDDYFKGRDEETSKE